jgi:hypothetical protein
MLEVQIDSIYNHRMKNKNNVTNRTVPELVNKIVELQDRKGNRDFAHSYALGTIQAILDWDLKGYYTGSYTLQEAINSSYETVKKELDEIEVLA